MRCHALTYVDDSMTCCAGQVKRESAYSEVSENQTNWEERGLRITFGGEGGGEMEVIDHIKAKSR